MGNNWPRRERPNSRQHVGNIFIMLLQILVSFAQVRFVSVLDTNELCARCIFIDNYEGLAHHARGYKQ